MFTMWIYFVVIVLGTTCLSLPLIPDDINQWNQIPSFRIHKRFWNRADLAPAVRHLGDVRGFFQKLNEGKAIVGVAFGSSFVHDFAGCFDTGPKRFEELDIVPSPFTYPQPGQNWTATIELMNRQQNNKCEDGGYMQALFHTINQTWPNPKHIFLNNAKGGASLDAIVDASCSSTFTPDDRVDLVFLDPATAASSPQSVEKLIRKYLRSKSRPLILMVSNSRQCEYHDQLKPGITGDTCPSHCLHKLEKAACSLLDQDPYPPTSEKLKADLAMRNTFHNISLYYNVTHLDLFQLMINWTHSPDMLSRSKSGSKYELVSKIYQDWVHFQKCYGIPGGKLFEIDAHANGKKEWIEAEHFKCDSNVTGSMILADILVHWLQTMQTRLGSDTTAPSDRPLPPPINDKVDEVFETRCYGFTFASIDSKEASEHLKDVAPGDFFGGGVGDDEQKGFGRPGGFHPLPPLNVTKSEGWILQSFYKGSNGSVKFKPGLFTEVQGSVLEFVVDSDLSSPSSSLQSLGRDPEVIVTYTSSWDGWGTARVSCVDGCTCAPTSFDSMAQSRHSLLQSLIMSISPHKECKMRVEATGPSNKANGISAHGSKLKISSILLRLAVKSK